MQTVFTAYSDMLVWQTIGADLAGDLKILFIQNKDNMKGENFCNLHEWEKLTKIGTWEFVLPGHYIQSAGAYRYLLSQNVYGSSPFTIDAEVQFSLNSNGNYFGGQPINAGFVLGWKMQRNSFSYYHLLITGSRLMLERIGSSGGDHAADFAHLDYGFPFFINDNQPHEFRIQVLQNTIEVAVDNLFQYQFEKPAGLEGLVGLRPWRSQMRCRRFEVVEHDQVSSSRRWNTFRNC